MPTEHINPDAVSRPNNYTHVVAAEGRRIVFVSGQVALDKDGNVVGKGDLARQAEQVFDPLASLRVRAARRRALRRLARGARALPGQRRGVTIAPGG